MRKSKHTEEQIAFALRQAQTGTRVEQICRKSGVSQATFYNWKKKYGDLGVSELRRLKQLEAENARPNEDGGGSESGQGDASGRDPEKALKPARRRELAHHIVEVYCCSKRRAAISARSKRRALSKRLLIRSHSMSAKATGFTYCHSISWALRRFSRTSSTASSTGMVIRSAPSSRRRSSRSSRRRSSRQRSPRGIS